MENELKIKRNAIITLFLINLCIFISILTNDNEIQAICNIFVAIISIIYLLFIIK